MTRSGRPPDRHHVALRTQGLLRPGIGHPPHPDLPAVGGDRGYARVEEVTRGEKGIPSLPARIPLPLQDPGRSRTRATRPVLSQYYRLVQDGERARQMAGSHLRTHQGPPRQAHRAVKTFIMFFRDFGGPFLDGKIPDPRIHKHDPELIDMEERFSGKLQTMQASVRDKAAELQKGQQQE
ncbi:hypothetical protein AK830_g12424 [Neonectria ditissima]|uniref:Uncharacterized protein n=1 Tax=Neonectria ditissima TaxID=78410 RepID=A0A0P7APK8_9HYPO|nr:hypothetical protein AK830_g12424 [Neonectria ditissima]